MAKRKKEQTDWVITKGQLARWQKEQQRRRQIIIIVSVIIAVVLALVIYAAYDTAVETDNYTVIKIMGPLGERTFDMDYYVDMLRIYGIHRVSPYEQGSKAQAVLGVIQTNEIYRQLAAGLNISVSEDEVTERILEDLRAATVSGTQSPTNPATPSYDELMEQYSQYLNQLDITDDQHRDAVESELLGVKLQQHIMEQEVPEKVMQVHLQGIKFDTSPAVIPGTGVDSAEPFQPATPQVTLGEPKDPMEIYEQIKTRLSSGEEFTALVEEYSVLSGTGNLGWFPREMVTMFYGQEAADTVFTIELNKLSEPIPVNESEDNTFYWLLRVTEKEERTLDEYYRTAMENQAFYDWYEQKVSMFSIEVKLDNEDIWEAIEKALKGIKL